MTYTIDENESPALEVAVSRVSTSCESPQMSEDDCPTTWQLMRLQDLCGTLQDLDEDDNLYTDEDGTPV